MRPQWCARNCIWVLATCPACGANGHGRVTVAVTLLLAVAHQVDTGRHIIAHGVPNPIFIDATARAVAHLTRRAAQRMGHLVWVHVAGFTSQEGQTCCHIARTHARGKSAGGAFRGGSGGSDTSPSAMHDCPGDRTGGSQKETQPLSAFPE